MKDLLSPNAVDILAIVAIVIGSLNGLRRGLSGELAGTLSAVLALLFGLAFYRSAGEVVAEHTRVSQQSACALTFIMAVIGAVVVMFLLRIAVKQAITIAINIKIMDRLWGIAAGAVKAAVLVAVVILSMNMWPHPYLNRMFGDESIIGSAMMRYMPKLREQAEEHLPGNSS